jgi:hypothetical protein
VEVDENKGINIQGCMCEEQCLLEASGQFDEILIRKNERTVLE